VRTNINPNPKWVQLAEKERTYDDVVKKLEALWEENAMLRQHW